MFVLRTLLVAILCSFLYSPVWAVPDENYDRSSSWAGTTYTQKHSKQPKSRTVSYASAGATPNSLVNEARRYLGTNPTSRRSLWCGAFMDLVLRRTGHRAGSNLASSYASYGRRVAGPVVGAIAVMTRGKGGGHVGVVSGIDQSGNVIVVSGNHNNTVAEAAYPRSRIYAYVMPDS